MNARMSQVLAQIRSFSRFFLERAVTARRNDEVLAARAPLSLRFYRPLTRSSKQKQTAPRFRPASSLGRHPSHVAAESRARGRRGTCHTVSQPAQLRPFPGPAAPCELERGPGRWWRSPRPAASDLKLVTNRPSFGLLGWVNLSAPDSLPHAVRPLCCRAGHAGRGGDLAAANGWRACPCVLEGSPRRPATRPL